jgi:uncharacterized phage infection (PIP) family protein YhgE
MSDPTTIPTDGQAEVKAEVKAEEPAEAKPEATSGVAAEASKTFDEVRKKLSEQLSELGTHVDGLSQKLTDAASHARQMIEKELQSLKTQHPDAFARLEELRQSGDESLDVLRGRLDKLAGDLEKAVSGFVSTLADQAKKATQSVTGGNEPAQAKSDTDQAKSDTATQSEAASPAQTDKPQS